VFSQGLLSFYGLPHPNAAAGTPAAPPPPKKPQGAKFELHTLPVRARPAGSRFLNLSVVAPTG